MTPHFSPHIDDVMKPRDTMTEKKLFKNCSISYAIAIKLSKKKNFFENFSVEEKNFSKKK
jgi:hypothetical protein